MHLKEALTGSKESIGTAPSAIPAAGGVSPGRRGKDSRNEPAAILSLASASYDYNCLIHCLKMVTKAVCLA
jgi:hypothetical protein